MRNAEKIKLSILTFFTAYSERDWDSMRNVCTKDFLIVENAEVLNIEDFMQIVGEINNQKFQRLNRLDFTHLEIEKEFATVIYFNEADISFEGYTIFYKWHESVILINENDSWKMKLLHSSLMDKKQLKMV